MDLDNLLEQIQQKKTVGTCWAAKLDNNDAVVFVNSVRALVVAGKHINWERTTAILVTEFNVQIGKHVVKDHLKGVCACARKKS